MMDKKIFYDNVRPALGALTMANVQGFELFLDHAIKMGSHIPIHLDSLAYILATVWWETGKTMQPVREAFWVSHTFEGAEAWRRKHLRYYPFYGRSYPQFTWEVNYKKASDTWNNTYRGNDAEMDFVKDPDAIMDPTYGVPLTFSAMEEGWFTGRSLEDYLDHIDESDSADFKEFRASRRVVNGQDRASNIANLALIFEHSLKKSGYPV